MITVSKQITTHFHSTEFRCKCGCGRIYIDEELVKNLEALFKKLNASKCIISSGYRCSKHDKNVGGNGYGQHTKGYAADCVYYDKSGKVIPAKIVICVAYDSGLFKGMANINSNYVHLDIRKSGSYRGDETRGVSSYWTNPYSYYGVSKSDVEKYTGKSVSTNVNVYYRVKTQKHGWLPEVKNTDDFAGFEDNPITAVAIKVDKGSVKYRVHIKGGSWLPYVTGYNTSDINNGYAGDTRVIDAVQVYYTTPNNIRPYKRAKYKVNNYSWQYDTETTKEQDGYAGAFGNAVKKFQIIIE